MGLDNFGTQTPLPSGYVGTRKISMHPLPDKGNIFSDLTIRGGRKAIYISYSRDNAASRPAMWMVGAPCYRAPYSQYNCAVWPNVGEIDIYEAIDRYQDRAVFQLHFGGSGVGDDCPGAFGFEQPGWAFKKSTNESLALMIWEESGKYYMVTHHNPKIQKQGSGWVIVGGDVNTTRTEKSSSSFWGANPGCSKGSPEKAGYPFFSGDFKLNLQEKADGGSYHIWNIRVFY